MINNSQLQTPVQTRLIASLLLTPNSCTDAINHVSTSNSKLLTLNSPLLTSLNTAAVLPVVFHVLQQTHLSKD